MDYLIIGLLVLIIILIVISLMKNINESKITDRLNNLEISTIKELNEFKDNLTKNLTDDFTKLNESLERRLLAINEGVNERINQNFVYFSMSCYMYIIMHFYLCTPTQNTMMY